MVAIPLPTSSAPGYRPQESTGRLINCFVEQIEESRIKRVRVPGMTSFLTSSQSGFRGMMAVAGTSTIYAAFKDKLFKGSGAGGAMAEVGPAVGLLGSNPVYFARNNRNPVDVVVVTENGPFVVEAPASPPIAAYP